MKKFFYYAFAVMTAMCMTACSSDDDDNTSKPKEVNLPTPKNVENAAQYVLTTPKAPEVAAGAEVNPDAPQLQTIDITESCELLLELRHPISKQIQYFKEKATLNGNVYTVNGQNVKGTVKVLGDAARATRSGTTNLEVNLEVKYTETEVYKYTTDDGTTITTIVEKPLTADEALARLSRTWNILGVILKLDSEDVDVSERWEAKNGLLNLETTVLKEALDQGVGLTAEEQNDLKKIVKGIIITGSGKRLFSLDYTNAHPDVATWEWANADKTMIKIKLKDEKMGNKFIQDASLVSFDFNGDRCNMKMVTTFNDNGGKKWDVELVVQTQASTN